MKKDAIFSDCRKYRYELSRYWDHSKPFLMIVGLNPSTADENYDDPTIRRCIGFAKAWGFGGIRMNNLFAYRATSPKEMLAQEHPVSEPKRPDMNDAALTQNAIVSKKILVCWGIHGWRNDRAQEVLKLLRQIRTVHCLAINQDGSPKHPLYVKGDVQPEIYE